MASEVNGTSQDTSWLYSPSFGEGWKTHSLWTLAEWVNGLAFRDINFTTVGRPVIKIAEIKNGISGQTKFTDAQYDAKVLVRSGDMLFAWSGQPETSIDVSWWRGPEGWLNQHIFKVTPTADECDPRFFYYILKYLRPNFVAIARNKQTTGLGHVTRKDLERLTVALPPLPEQRRIAHILGTLDDKIELNRRMNATLEAMARALFQSWFVDFDPVRAKAEGRDPGLPADVAALFPASFTDSELGEIPAGWEVTSIYNVANVFYGAPFASNRFNTEGRGLPLIRIRDLKTNTPEQYTDEALPNGRVIQPGDIVVGMDGEFRAYRWLGLPSYLNQRVCSFVPKPAIPKTFVALSIVEHLRFFESAKTGTTVIHIGKSDIDTFRVIKPLDALLNVFGNVVEPLYERVVLNAAQGRTLAALRDTLLPKLLSGEVRVPAAEHQPAGNIHTI